MADTPSGSKDKSNDLPAPEVLKEESDDTSSSVPSSPTAPKSANGTGQAVNRRRRGSYRPSHKATFIGLAVVVAILAINAGIIAFFLKNQSKKNNTNNQTVTISQSALDKLGVNSTAVGDSGIVLNIGPNTDFGGNIQVAGSATISGQLKLNSKLSASSASFNTLQAGNTSLSQLNVNGSGTFSSLNLRQNLTVAGDTSLEGNVSFSKLVTVNNNLNVVGSLAVGGTLAVANFQTTTLTIGGHVVTAGNAPGVSKGSALNSADTVTISGDDAAGTVAVNIGYSSVSGIVANISFTHSYSNIPHVIVTAVGPGAQNVYVERSSSGFSIGVSSMGTGGHAFDYIVEQ